MNPQLTSALLKEILAGLASPDMSPRHKALERLYSYDVSALLLLADFIGSTDRAEAKAAKKGMEQLVQYLLLPSPGTDRIDSKARTALADTLLDIARSSRPRMTRSHALYLLGFSGDRRQEKALAGLEKSPEIGEDAYMARKRIQSVRY